MYENKGGLLHRSGSQNLQDVLRVEVSFCRLPQPLPTKDAQKLRQ